MVRRGNICYFNYTLKSGDADFTTTVGDWDGDGCDSLAVRRDGNCYYFCNDITNPDADTWKSCYGQKADQVLVGDWEGNGYDSLAVRRDGNCYYFSLSEVTDPEEEVRKTYFGSSDDEVLVGDWDANGTDTLAMRRDGNTYYISNSIADPDTDVDMFSFGKASDTVYAGKWQTYSVTEYTKGEWVSELTEYLGITLAADVDDIDYYFADTEQSEYGVAIETAQKYGILPEPDVEDVDQDIPYFEPDEMATREFAAYTAVQAMGFFGDYTIDTSSWKDWEDITYQTQAALAIQMGFLSLEEDYFLPDDILDTDDVISIENEIAELNASTQVEEEYDNSEYREDVNQDELETVTDYTITDNGDGTYTVVMPYTDSITEDNVFILPANDEHPEGVALKAVSVSQDSNNNGQILCVIPEAEEVFTSIDIAEAGIAMVDSFEAADGIEYEYDAEGTIDEGEISTYATVGGSVEVPGKLTFKFAEKEFSDNCKATGSVEITIPDITCKLDADFSLLSGITINEFTLSMREKIKFNSELEYTSGESAYELTDSAGDTSFESGRIELGRLPIAIGATGLFIDIVFYCNISVKGTVSISYTFESTQGYQYKDGASRVIFDFDDNLEMLNLKATTKVGVGVTGDICAFELLDLAGYSAEAGLAVDASFTAHLLAQEPLYCADATKYVYVTSGLDKETVLGKFLSDVCHYTLEFEHLKNNEKNPFKQRFHVENGLIVDECTHGVGEIFGYVRAADDDEPIEKARIRIYSTGSLGDDLVRTLYTDMDGHFSVDNLHDGSYLVSVSATGCYTYIDIITVEADETAYLNTYLMVDRDSGEGDISGTITDALTGSGIEGANYAVRTGWSNTDGDAIASGTFESDVYTLTLSAGNYTIEVKKNEYTSNYANVAVVADSCAYLDITLSPDTLENAGDLRIVLTWGETPSDLDSHLFGTLQDGTYEFHTYYSSKNYYNDEVLIADLDLDDMSSYGPETTTVYSMGSDDIYSFYVHDYTNRSSNSSMALSQSDAKVQVYIDGTYANTYYIPLNTEGTVWHVFDYDASTGRMTSVNELYYSSNPATLARNN